MRSRYRPAKAYHIESSLDGVFRKKVCDEITNIPNEILNTTNNIIQFVREYNYMKLHITLKQLMKKNKESARSAAKAMGIPLSTFSGYLKPGKHQLDINHLIAIASHYKVSLDYLVSGKNEKVQFKGLQTKKLFSRWVKLTIEDVAGEDEKE